MLRLRHLFVHSKSGGDWFASIVDQGIVSILNSGVVTQLEAATCLSVLYISVSVDV
jgi:hypothetical protein